MGMNAIDVSSTTRRAKLAWFVLACLLAWPPTQHILHRTYRVSPWKLLGLGVYCRPKLTIELEVRIDGHAEDTRGLGIDAPLSRLRQSTRTWGVLANPDEVGCALLQLHPDAAQLDITRRERDLSASGWIRENRYTWHVNLRHCDARRER